MSFPNVISGHASGHVRDTFCELVEDRSAWSSTAMRQVTGRLWNCTDIMPREVCAEVDLPQGSTYAQGVRALHRT